MTKPLLYTAKTFEEPLTLAYDDALNILREGTIQMEHGLMRWGSNHTFLVEVECSEAAFMAIYKPRSGERPLWDFPDGTLCQRETAAYTLSEALGWYLVPPTVLRDGPRGIGSVQVFIDHNPEQHYFNFDDTSDDADALQPQLQRMAAFDALANNADRKGGHCLLDEDEHLWGIDHGLTFHAMQKLRTVIWKFAGQPIADDICDDLQAFCERLDMPDDPRRQQLTELLSASEMQALRRRLERLLDEGSYPMPGPGPNRPWPAI